MKIFIAGATGFTGRAMASLPGGGDLLLQVRSASRGREVFAGDERTVVVDVDDREALTDALLGVDVVVQLIGTVRRKFDSDTNYEIVDYGTTVSLIAAARRAHVKHLVLVSSVGAGFGLGSYLHWKKRTEAAVRKSSVPYTIVRPGMIAGAEGFDERPRNTALGAFLHGVSDTPFGSMAADLRPMPVTVLAEELLHIARGPAKNAVVQGRHLWRSHRKAETNALEAL